MALYFDERKKVLNTSNNYSFTLLDDSDRISILPLSENWEKVDKLLKPIQLRTFVATPDSTAEVPHGVVRLWSDTGNGVDGTMTQKAITEKFTQICQDIEDASAATKTAYEAAIKKVDDKVAILNGNANQTGSVKKQIADAIAQIVANAPASFDTLKEIADWISSHANSASEMNSKISTNTSNITTLSKNVDKSIKSVQSSIDSLQSRLDQVETQSHSTNNPENNFYRRHLITGVSLNPESETTLEDGRRTGCQHIDIDLSRLNLNLQDEVEGYIINIVSTSPCVYVYPYALTFDLVDGKASIDITYVVDPDYSGNAFETELIYDLVDPFISN